MINTYNSLAKQFKVSNFVQKRPDLAFVSVDKHQAVALLTHLRDVADYTHLALMTAVDWLEENQFQLTYMLHNYKHNCNLGVRVFIDHQMPIMDSIHHLWQQARVYQQELHEMFGIDFPGSPGVNQPMILEGWFGPPPMRRDFDTKKYSEETFDHRPRNHQEPETYMKEKLYPED